MRSKQIISLLETIDVGQPIVKLINRSHSIYVQQLPWSVNLVGDTFMHHVINNNIYREALFIGEKKGYRIDNQSTLHNIKNSVLNDFLNIVVEVMPNKEPRRTNLWHSLKSIKRKANHSDFDSEIFTEIFDVSDYFFTVTRESSIKSSQNQVHRTNILHILKSMEQKHGKPVGLK